MLVWLSPNAPQAQIYDLRKALQSTPLPSPSLSHALFLGVHGYFPHQNHTPTQHHSSVESILKQHKRAYYTLVAVFGENGVLQLCVLVVLRGVQIKLVAVRSPRNQHVEPQHTHREQCFSSQISSLNPTRNGGSLKREKRNRLLPTPQKKQPPKNIEFISVYMC